VNYDEWKAIEDADAQENALDDGETHARVTARLYGIAARRAQRDVEDLPAWVAFLDALVDLEYMVGSPEAVDEFLCGIYDGNRRIVDHLMQGVSALDVERQRLNADVHRFTE
jgi:hypothetical protein